MYVDRLLNVSYRMNYFEIDYGSSLTGLGGGGNYLKALRGSCKLFCHLLKSSTNVLYM